MNTATQTPAAVVVTPAVLAAFLAFCQGVVDTHYATHFSNLTSDLLSVMKGRRYAKIVATRRGDHSTGRSVYCFVDMTNGDILKSASWKAPAMHARGNVLDASTYAAAITPYGAAYLT